MDVDVQGWKDERLRRRRKWYHARRNRETAKRESRLEEQHAKRQHAMMSTEQVTLLSTSLLS